MRLVAEQPVRVNIGANNCTPPLATGPFSRIEGPLSRGEAHRVPNGNAAAPKPLQTLEP